MLAGVTGAACGRGVAGVAAALSTGAGATVAGLGAVGAGCVAILTTDCSAAMAGAGADCWRATGAGVARGAGAASTTSTEPCVRSTTPFKSPSVVT